MVLYLLNSHVIKLRFFLYYLLNLHRSSDLKSIVANSGEDGLQLSSPPLISTSAICHVTGIGCGRFHPNLAAIRAGQTQFGSADVRLKGSSRAPSYMTGRSPKPVV